MKLSQCLSYVSSSSDCLFTYVTSDTRAIKPGSLFVCIQGEKFDGHDHIAEAEEKGAVGFVVQRPVQTSLPVHQVENTRAAYGILCAAINHNPSKRLKLIGVTGTNGKTTTTTIIKQILTLCGETAGLIGTIQNEIGSMQIPAKFTTPDPYELHALFARMEKAGCTHVSMEVSSHALDQSRLSGCRFQVGVFTNLTQDHLDYHGTMENYFEAKQKLFPLCRTAVINLDDDYGRRLLNLIPPTVRLFTFSAQDPSADFFADQVSLHAKGVDFLLRTADGEFPVHFCMPGAFSVSNALAALGAVWAAGIPIEKAVEAIGRCHGVKGRTEVLDTGTDFTVICDYAHSADSLEKELAAIKEFTQGTLWALFGPAGNRDRSKRPKMAAAAAKYADFVVLTSDNPRSEPPAQILADAEPGFAKANTPYIKIVDRYEAIRWVLSQARPGDVVALCGKGHEDYQVLADRTICFDEHEIVKKLVQELRQAGRLH